MFLLCPIILLYLASPSCGFTNQYVPSRLHLRKAMKNAGKKDFLNHDFSTFAFGGNSKKKTVPASDSSLKEKIEEATEPLNWTIANLTRTKGQLKSNVTSLKNVIRELQNQEASQKQECSAAVARMKSLKSELGEVKLKVKSLSLELSKAKVEVKSLTSELSNATGEVESLTSELSNAKGEVKSLTSQLSNAKGKAKSLTTELSNAKEKVKSLTKELGKAEEKEESLNSELDKATQNLQAEQNESVILQNKLDKTVEEMKTVKASEEEKKTQVNSVTTELTKTKEKLQTEVNKTLEINTELKNTAVYMEQEKNEKISKSKSGRKEKMKAKLSAKLNRALKNVKALESEKGKLQKQLDKLKGQKKVVTNNTRKKSSKLKRCRKLFTHNKAADICYRVKTKKYSFNKAQSYCKRRYKGRLAVLNTPQKFKAVNAAVKRMDVKLRRERKMKEEKQQGKQDRRGGSRGGYRGAGNDGGLSLLTGIASMFGLGINSPGGTYSSRSRAQASSGPAAPSSFWVGCHNGANGREAWTDGTPVGAKMWNPGEPNYDHEKCGALEGPHFRLNDALCEAAKHFVCEYQG